MQIKWPVLLLMLLGCTSAPTESDAWAGTYVEENINLILTIEPAKNKSYKGTFTINGYQYAVDCKEENGALTGKYADQNELVPFELKAAGSEWNLLIGEEILTLKKEINETSSTVGFMEKKGEGHSPDQEKKRITNQEEGYSFLVPDGWTVTEENGTYKLSNNGVTAELTVSSHYSSNIEEIMNESTETIRNDETNTVLKPTVKRYGENGVQITMTGRAGGKPISIEVISLVASGGGGPVYAVSTYEGNAADYLGLLEALAKSTRFFTVKESGIASSWKKKLEDKELVYLKTEGGGSTKIRLTLNADGSFIYVYESSYLSGGSSTLSYADQDKDWGKWKISSRGNRAVLIINSQQSGETSELEIEEGQSGGEVYLDSKRYFIRN